MTLFYLEAWRQASLARPLAELASFARAKAKLFALAIPVLTQLSHGGPHVSRFPRAVNKKTPSLTTEGFYLEAWR